MPQIATIVGRKITFVEDTPRGDAPTKAFVGVEPVIERQFIDAFVHTRAKATHAGSGCAFVTGFVALLIPIVGWIIGPMLIVASVFWLIAPRLAYKWIQKEEFAQLQRTAHAAARNSYFNLKCPSCGAPWASGKTVFFFLADPEGVDCDVCKRRVVRNGDHFSAT